MRNARKTVSATFAAIVIAAASLAASPALAQTDPPSDDKDPVYCAYTTHGQLFCCRIYESCPQIYYDNAIDDRRPEEPAEPSESPKA